jgi:hypothetical protein
MGHKISREALRDNAASLTRLGLMNFGFQGPGLPGDHHYMIRMVNFDPQRTGLLLGPKIRKSPARSKYCRCCCHHTLER